MLPYITISESYTSSRKNLQLIASLSVVLWETLTVDSFFKVMSSRGGGRSNSPRFLAVWNPAPPLLNEIISHHNMRIRTVFHLRGKHCSLHWIFPQIYRSRWCSHSKSWTFSKCLWIWKRRQVESNWRWTQPKLGFYWAAHRSSSLIYIPRKCQLCRQRQQIWCHSTH